MSGAWQQRYLDKYYRSRPGWISGNDEFHRMCAAAIPRGGRILEIGFGPSNATSRFLAAHGELEGVDVDAEARNDAVRRAHVIVGGRYPIPDASIDGCVSMRR